MNTKLQNGTVILKNPPHILGGGAVGGKKESYGPLSDWFYYLC